MGISWGYHGDIVGISWGYHGDIMGISWGYHGGYLWDVSYPKYYLMSVADGVDQLHYVDQGLSNLKGQRKEKSMFLPLSNTCSALLNECSCNAISWLDLI